MKIFISYRRADTRHLAGRLADFFREARNVDTVFIDVDSIAPGAQFEVEMIRELRESDICFALIGENWAAGDRIHEETDPIRLEIKAALAEVDKNSLQLTPILADGAQMPPPEALPPDLRALCKLNGRPLRHATFKSDIEFLSQQLGIELMPERTLLGTIARTAGGMGIALVLFFLVSLIHKGLLKRSLETSLGGPAALIAVLVLVLAMGAAVPILWQAISKRI